jgi:hypothetical protein
LVFGHPVPRDAHHETAIYIGIILGVAGYAHHQATEEIGTSVLAVVFLALPFTS